ncbi:unnamed protein product [Moneuplotes crassus]|uniref:Uncharacterized protein n=1 Tax=Euplotes crassus TaxID=5936 RepID=A0AAD2D6B8_EUPCR|nr:unnamed protein product [Moneuplotes crassus]
MGLTLCVIAIADCSNKFFITPDFGKSLKIYICSCILRLFAEFSHGFKLKLMINKIYLNVRIIIKRL